MSAVISRYGPDAALHSVLTRWCAVVGRGRQASAAGLDLVLEQCFEPELPRMLSDGRNKVARLRARTGGMCNQHAVRQWVLESLRDLPPILSGTGE